MRQIEKRLRKLEAKLKLRDQPRCSGLACVWHFIPIERRNNLAPGERIVVDWYRNGNSMTYGRQRITDDPADQGRKCKVGGYLLDVLKEIHQNCSHRERTGSCLVCKDTPLAEEPPNSSINSED